MKHDVSDLPVKFALNLHMHPEQYLKRDVHADRVFLQAGD